MKPTLLLLFAAITVQAQLAVTVLPVKITGQKAVVPLALQNNLDRPVESARAACFLLDEQGKMIGQGTRWVIGGSLQTATGERLALEPGATNAFHLVITSTNPSGFMTTNLTAKVTFNRVVLEGGKLADPMKDVIVQPTSD